MPAVTAVVSALLARAVENHRKEQSNVATRCLNAWGRDGLRPRSVEHECQCRWHSGSGGLSLREQNSALADEFASSTSNPPPDYILRAQQVLNTRYGSGRFAVAAQTAPVGTVSGDRYNDSPPWWGGEQIFDPMSSEGCSDGFAVLDPNGDEAMMTADHCGPLYSYEFISSWQYTGGCYGPCQEEEVGQITWEWGPDGSNTCEWSELGCSDFATIQTQGITGGVQADVYNGGPGSSVNTGLPVLGDTFPGNGTEMTFDGAVSGQQADELVENNWTCQDLSGYSVGYAGVDMICGVGVIENGSNGSSVSACAPGDSGGPTYVREDGGTVAAGIVLGEGTYNYLPACYFQEWIAIEQTAPSIQLLTR